MNESGPSWSITISKSTRDDLSSTVSISPDNVPEAEWLKHGKFWRVPVGQRNFLRRCECSPMIYDRNILFIIMYTTKGMELSS